MDSKLEVGSSIIYVDAHAKEHHALVTVVWSGMSGQEGEPGCNLVFVYGDDSKTDPYGRQIERSTSVVHRSKQAAYGNFWDWPSK